MATQQHRWILCGGLASGKSTVRQILSDAGISTIDADSVGHEVIAPDGSAFRSVAARWPGVVVNDEIDRAALADVVFNDAGALGELETLTHPHIFDTIRRRVEEIRGPVVVEVPLLSHGLGSDWRRIVVDCRDEVRLRRAVERGMEDADARARIASQPSREVWLGRADVVIPNHSDRVALEECVARLVDVM